MSSNNFEIDYSDVIKKLKKIKEEYPKESKKAMSKSINLTLIHVRKDLGRKVKDEFNITASRVKSKIQKKNSTTNTLKGQLDSSDYRLRLGLFNPTASTMKIKNTKKSGRVVTYKPPKVKVRRGKKKQLPQGYFTAKSKVTGQLEVFQINPKSKYRLNYGFTLSVPQMILWKNQKDGVYAKNKDDYDEFFQKKMKQQLNYYINVANQKASK